MLHPGFTLELFADEGKGYYLNLTSGHPVWFVTWRIDEDDPSIARPERVSLSYIEADRWMSAGEQVENVPLPAELVDWLQRLHRRPFQARGRAAPAAAVVPAVRRTGHDGERLMAGDVDDDRPFLSRWSRRKAQARAGLPVREEPVVPPGTATTAPTPAVPAPPVAVEPAAVPPAPDAPPPATMDDVAALTRASDYSRFVAPGVDRGVSNAAMKKLFSDPHFNVMDRLDIYIDDYGKPDPIPPEMLRKMVQSRLLGLFDDEKREEGEEDLSAQPAGPYGAPSVPITPQIAAGSADDNRPHDDHPDLQLQPHDAAGRRGADEGAGPGEVGGPADRP